MCTVDSLATVMSAVLGVGLMVGAACSSGGRKTADRGTDSTGSSIVQPAPSAATTPAPGDEAVSGTLVLSGGPYPGHVIPVAGEVRAHFVGTEAPPIIAVADEEGRFGFRLHDGRYQLSATSPSYNGGMAICESGQVVVVGAPSSV
jgi:hypothetical protein